MNILIAIAIVFLLTACGGGGSKDELSIPQPQPQSQTTTSTAPTNESVKALILAGGTVYLPSGKFTLGEVKITKSNTILIGNNTTFIDTFIKFDGKITKKAAIANVEFAARGSAKITVNDVSKLSIGKMYSLYVSGGASLIDYLYQGVSGNTSGLGNISRSMKIQIIAINGKVLTLKDPTLFEIRPEWNTRIRTFEYSLYNVGIERVRFEFTSTSAPTHLEGESRHALTFNHTVYSYASFIDIDNANNGLSISSFFGVYDNITITSDVYRNNKGNYGHHGVTLMNTTNLLTNYRIETKYRHDITFAGSSMNNTISFIYGEDLSIDFHCKAPFGNLIRNVDAGMGKRLWYSGGNDDCGSHAGAFNTTKNVYPYTAPPSDFGPEIKRL